MFERLQKPFLTVETGEAYQPIRLEYDVYEKEKLIAALNTLKCLDQKHTDSWTWFWAEECDNEHFESVDSFKKNDEKPLRLGTLVLRNDKLYVNLPSFKRACLAVPFFHKIIKTDLAKVLNADFINKVFGLNERLPHGFTELFDEKELARISQQRITDYENVQARVESAKTAEEAFTILSSYTDNETKKRLPYAERYTFYDSIIANKDPDVVFLGFYIFLRGRELVAIRRWFGESGYSLSDAAEETIEKVFGGMNIDIID